MIIASNFDTRIEPHVLSRQDLITDNPFVYEIIKPELKLNNLNLFERYFNNYINISLKTVTILIQSFTRDALCATCMTCMQNKHGAKVIFYCTHVRRVCFTNCRMPKFQKFFDNSVSEFSANIVVPTLATTIENIRTAIAAEIHDAELYRTYSEIAKA